MTEIYVCPWCSYRFPPDGKFHPQKDYEFCPQCYGCYSFVKPILINLGDGI